MRTATGVSYVGMRVSVLLRCATCQALRGHTELEVGSNGWLAVRVCQAGRLAGVGLRGAIRTWNPLLAGAPGCGRPVPLHAAVCAGSRAAATAVTPSLGLSSTACQLGARPLPTTAMALTAKPGSSGDG
eukprot:366069-Chlamydomonas_euryale.AAC.1